MSIYKQNYSIRDQFGRFNSGRPPMALVKHRPRSMRVKPLLQRLSLSYGTRWEEAAPKIKEKIVEARRLEADDIAAFWSLAKNFLKRNLKHLCSCGKVIGGKERQCFMCQHKDGPIK